MIEEQLLEDQEQKMPDLAQYAVDPMKKDYYQQWIVIMESIAPVSNSRLCYYERGL